MDRYICLIRGNRIGYYHNEKNEAYSLGEIFSICGKPHDNQMEFRKVKLEHIGVNQKLERDSFHALLTGRASQEQFETLWSIGAKY